MTTNIKPMHYEVWPGETKNDPYSIKETWLKRSRDGGEEYLTGKTVGWFDNFVEAITACTELNKLL